MKIWRARTLLSSAYGPTRIIFGVERQTGRGANVSQLLIPLSETEWEDLKMVVNQEFEKEKQKRRAS